MKKQLLFTLVGFCIVTPCIFSQAKPTPDKTSVATTQPIPEEARKHFVMGTTLFKDAKTADDFVQVVSEFKQATDLAPQWPDARYNLALAKEAAGDYSGAIGDLKLYQQFKLSDTEARTAQDKIYALEAKQQKAVDVANSPAAQLEKFIKSLDGGVWRMDKTTQSIDGGSWYTAFDQSNSRLHTGDVFLEIHGHEISGWSRLFQANPRREDQFKTTFNDRQFNVDPGLFSAGFSFTYYKITISPDGQSIAVESLSGHFQGRSVFKRIS
jgi:hypothetical protein